MADQDKVDWDNHVKKNPRLKDKLKILSNSGKKPRVGLSGYGLSIDEYIKY